MKHVVFVGVVVVLPVLLVATPAPADHVFEGCVGIPGPTGPTGTSFDAGIVLGDGDRIAGPTSSTGIPLDARTVFEGCDRIFGPTSSTGIPILPAFSGSLTAFLQRGMSIGPWAR